MRTFYALAVVGFLCFPSLGHAQQPTVVPNCGTASVSGSAPGTQNANGALCIDAGRPKEVCVTPTVTATNSYGTNYVVGGLLTFANLFPSSGTGVLQGVRVDIKAVETSGFTFIPFSSHPSNTTWTDAAVAAINAADKFKALGPVSLAANSQLAASGMSVQFAYGLGLPWVASATSGYGVLLANAALTTQFGAASDVQVCVQVVQAP